MTLRVLPANVGQGGIGAQDLGPAIKELQGFRQSAVAGAAAGTKMDVANLRTEDTIVGAVVTTDAGGALADDLANVTVQGTGASGTVTVAAVNDGDTVTINGVVFTFKDVPTLVTHVKRTAGDNTLNAAKLASVVNDYPFRYGGAQSKVVNAVAAVAVVTLTAIADGTAGNAIVLLSSDGTRLAVTGAGTLTGGTATGGFKSTTNLTGKSVILSWFDKNY